ncbi:HK97 gp10 family phage protein [Zhenpiania hominis]|uniref:HK97 gp10 family phage protein n=1 Tax=Zhenpiania hominis TaxID=2763644 RepID=A0A923NQN3_9FIRM|nr:HK97 gp10 family phage protein [Zhenpiania hominis]MBC6681319.1 HK97 gp10 family phage protein [Zhenpiania hominis]
MGIEFELEGTGELETSLKKAMKQYPASAERVLKKEARRVAKDLKQRVRTEAKGHHYVSEGETHKPLANSFRPGKVIRSGSKMTAAVTSNAPHYHLYEEGHGMFTHSGRYVGDVKGRKTVARYMSQRSEKADEIGEQVLNEILKEVGLD